MAKELFPTFDVPDISEDSEEYDSEYKWSIKWNPRLGDFVRDSSNRLVECDGREAFMIWCYKAVQTERNSHMAYISEVTGEDIGVDMDEALADDDHEIVESMIERTITETLEMNPRTELVNNFSFEWEGDEVHFSFDVKGVDWDEKIRITV